MNTDVNPFEPWRPAGPEQHQQSSTPGEPGSQKSLKDRVVDWLKNQQSSTPGEPGSPDGTGSPPPNAARLVSSLQSQPSSHTPLGGRALRPDEITVLLFFVALGLAGAMSLASLPGSHVTRVGAACLSAALGVGAGISLARNRRWPVRVGCVIGGLGLAALAWWFVPTTRGISLWSVQSEVASLQALPAGDIEGYRQGRRLRAEMAEQFPSFKADLERLARDWFQQTADRAVAQANTLLPSDPAAVSAKLQQLDRDLFSLDDQSRPHYALVKARLLAARRQAVLARLEAARKQGLALWRQDRYQELVQSAERLAAEMGIEADAVGEKTALVSFYDSSRALGALARAAGKMGP
jgi:hypothetical protein